MAGGKNKADEQQPESPKKPSSSKTEPLAKSPSFSQAETPSPQPAESSTFPIVGIGASAGGLKALEEFFAYIAPNCGMAFVLIQRSDVSHQSILPELIGRYTEMPVHQAEDGTQLEPNSVYVIPSNRYMVLIQGNLQLLEPVERRRLCLPIDCFFRSLADDQGRHAIGIILSGTGTDGTLGLKAIKGMEGLAIVQTPESAQYGGMPCSAISTGLVDYILPPKAMPDRLTAYVQQVFVRKIEPDAISTPRQPAEADLPGQSVPCLTQDKQFGELNTGHNRSGSSAAEQVELATAELEQQVREQTAKLRQERNFIAAVLDTAGALVVVLDADGHIVRFNKACERTSGYTFDEVKGRRFWDLFLPKEEIAPLRAVFDQLRSGQFPAEYQNYWLTREGCYRLISWSTTALLDQTGAVEYIVGIGIDISERKQAEEEIEHSRHWLERIADTTPDIIFVYDIVSNRNVYTNRSILEILGYTSEDFRQLPDVLQKVIHPDDLLQVEEFYRNMADAEPGLVRLLTHRALHKDGNIRWIEIRVTPFTWDKDNILREVLGFAHDITERMRLGEILKTQGLILDNMAEGVLVADEDNRIYFTNPAFDAMFGYEPGELRGQDASVLNLDPEQVAAMFAAEINLALQTTGTWSGEFGNRKKDGNPFVTSARISRLDMPDRTLLISVQEDITERRQAELEKAKLFEEVNMQRDHLRSLAKRLAEIQEVERMELSRELHDQLGRDLTALDLNLSVIQTLLAGKGTAEKPIQARLDDSLALVKQMGRYVRTVMATLRPPALDDYGLVAALRWYSGELAGRAPFTITTQGEALNPRMPAAAELALFRIAQEALTNTAKHAQASQAVITVAEEEGIVRLVVGDDGRGFDLAPLSDPLSERGWGLITMVERAEAVGATCRIVSAPGQGTRVIVEVARSPGDVQ